MVGRYRYAAFGRFAAGISMVILAVSCGFPELEVFDAFSPYLQKAEASVNLKSALKNEGFSSDVRFIRIEQATSPADGSSLVLAYLEEGELHRLIVLEAGDLSVVRIEENFSFDAFLGADTQGRFLSGSGAFTLGASSATKDTEFANLLEQFDNHQVLASIGTGAYNALFGVSGSTIRLFDFDKAKSWSTYASYSAELADSSDDYKFLDVLRGDGKSDIIRVLLSRGERMIVASFNDFSELRTTLTDASSGSDFVSESSTVSGPVFKSGKAWITRDGVVVADDGTKQLKLYSFPDLADDDAISIGTDYEDSFISVDAGGDRWFFYDAESSWLYALRTWW